MAAETVLHTGTFVDHNDDVIKVTFFRHIDLNAQPTSLSFSDAGGTRRLTIWSNMGDAHLADPTVEWLNYRLVSTEPVIGTDYYKYTYDITCSSNSGADRETDLQVDLRDNIPGEKIYVHVTQIAGYVGLAVSPSLWSVTGGGESQTFTITNGMIGISQTISYSVSDYGTNWLSVTYLASSTANVTAWANNTSTSRFATIKFYELSNPENFATVDVSQDRATLTVSPSYLRFSVGEAHSGFTARWAGGYEPTMSLEYESGASNWMSIDSGSVSGSMKTWNMVVYSNTTLMERRAMVTITNGIDSVSLPIMQNLQ